jgi:nitrite reductase/ring-hydroxylating ferredoxin subunit
LRPTATSDLIDVQTREVKMRAFSDESVYDTEMRKVFGQAWLLLAHESEIPKAGNFVVRDMGGDRVIVSRDSKGDIHVLLNVCPHRGMRVCMTEEGHAPAFQCMYHGWTFRHDGRFVGAPIPREQMQGDVLDKSELGLKPARVHLYGGLVFATWNMDGPSFDAWLGDYKFYTDALFLRTKSGIEMLGPPQKALIQANWKTAGEQFAGDGYHTLTLHRSLMELGRVGGTAESAESEKVAPGMYAVEISANGHGMRMIPPYKTLKSLIGKQPTGISVMEQLELLPPPGLTRQMVPQLKERLSDDQLWLLAQHPPSAGGMFPNVGFLWFYTQQLDGTIVPRMGIHTFVPRGPHQFEYWTWVFAEKDAPEELKQKMLEASVQSLGNTGMTEMDDAETWPHIQEAARGPVGRDRTIKYQALAGENRPADWPPSAGGHVYNGFSKDDNQWNWWLRWRELMDAPE